MANKHPNLFLVGAPKCGTTSMAHYLGQHPQIYVPTVKEPNFFVSDIGGSDGNHNEEQYSELYSDWGDELYALDASTAYIVSRSAFSEIHRFCPTAKILIMLRNPVDATYSLFCHQKFYQTEPLETFEEALADQERREKHESSWKRGFLELHIYRRVYAFKENIQRYLDRFEKENVKLIFLEDLEADPEKVMSDIALFLGVVPFASLDFQKKNRSKQVALPGFQDFLNRPPLWLGFFTKWWLSPKIRWNIRTHLIAMTVRTKQNPPMNKEARRFLVKMFATDIDALSDMTGRDLSHWLKTE